MEPQFLLNGVANGTIAQRLLATDGDVGVLRPYVGPNGQSMVTVFAGNDDNGEPTYKEIPLHNAGATLRKNEWEQIDEMVAKVAKPRLQLVNSLRASGLSVNLRNGWGKSVFQYERQSDISDARVSMDGLTPGDNDRPVYDLVNLPLPIISKKVTMNSRAIAISRNGNTPLDLSNLELAAYKIAQMAEKFVLGTSSSYTYAGATAYGLMNHPNRLTGNFLNPTVSGWTPEMLYNSVIGMMVQSTNAYHFGPWKLYYSTGLMKYMMQRFSTYDFRALINVIKELPNIQDVQMLDHMSGNELLLVEQSSQTVRVINGMDLTTVQWSTPDGLEEAFMLMAMIVPQVKYDQNGNTGLVHYTGSATTT